MYSGVEALPTTDDSQSDVPTVSSSDVITGSGDLSVGDNVTTGDHHDDSDVTAAAVAPPTSCNNDIITGNITDSDEELMSTKSAGKDDDWVIVERPSLTSDDQSLDSVDSIVDDEVLPEGNTVTIETTDQEPEEVEMTDVATEVVDDDKHISMEIVENNKHVTMDTVDNNKQDNTLPLLSDTATNQDGGGSTADDEAEDDDEVDTKDWWRTKGPSTTTSVDTKQQPRWTSLKFTRQLKSRWGMTSSSPVATMTTVAKEPPKTSTSPVLPSKTNELSTWFPDEDDRKEPVFPSAGEIAEAKQLQEKMAAEAAAKKTKKSSPTTSDHSDKEQQCDTQQQTQSQQQETQHKQDTPQQEQKQQQPEMVEDTQPTDQPSSTTDSGE